MIFELYFYSKLTTSVESLIASRTAQFNVILIWTDTAPSRDTYYTANTDGSRH